MNRDQVEIHRATNATEALEALTTFSPTLMLIDASVAGDLREAVIGRAQSVGCSVIASGPGIDVAIPGSSLHDLEKYAILETLKAVGGKTSKAARILGISVRKIQYRMKDWGMRSDELAPKHEVDAESAHH